MTLKVVGAGLGRTGTHSLKLALEQLLGGPCYHMVEVFGRPDDIPVWHAAVNGEMPDWNSVPRGVPRRGRLACLRVLAGDPRPRTPTRSCCSRRATPKVGGRARTTRSSRSPTARYRPAKTPSAAQMKMALDMFAKTFTPKWQDESDSEAARTRRTTPTSRASVPADQLIDYRPGDGWEPICEKLGLPVPSRAVPARQHDRRVPCDARHGAAELAVSRTPEAAAC